MTELLGAVVGGAFALFAVVFAFAIESSNRAMDDSRRARQALHSMLLEIEAAEEMVRINLGPDYPVLQKQSFQQRAILLPEFGTLYKVNAATLNELPAGISQSAIHAYNQATLLFAELDLNNELLLRIFGSVGHDDKTPIRNQPGFLQDASVKVSRQGDRIIDAAKRFHRDFTTFRQAALAYLEREAAKPPRTWKHAIAEFFEPELRHN